MPILGIAIYLVKSFEGEILFVIAEFLIEICQQSLSFYLALNISEINLTLQNCGDLSISMFEVDKKDTFAF